VHVERLEFPEIAVVGVQRPHALPEMDRREVRFPRTGISSATCQYASGKPFSLDAAHTCGSLTSAGTLPSASSGVSGWAKMRGCVAMFRYDISVG
jgi:hypothetical protein